ncbi:MAG: hypothetical protein Q7T56_19680 [Nocardioidaceae bacterium]|nr:hypothetical protein [Nocardioidaceae bacterium]
MEWTPDLEARLIAELKSLRRYSPVTPRLIRERAPLLAARLGRGDVLATIRRLREFDVDEDHQRDVDAALEALGLGRHRGSVQTRLIAYGASLRPPVGYWQARRLGDRGIETLARELAGRASMDNPGIVLQMDPGSAEGTLRFELQADISNARQSLYLDIHCRDGIGNITERVVEIERGSSLLDTFEFDSVAIGDGNATLGVKWPEGVYVPVAAYSSIARSETVHFYNSAWISICPELPP